MNRGFVWRRHWKLIVLLALVMILLLTVFGNVEMAVPGIGKRPPG